MIQLLYMSRAAAAFAQPELDELLTASRVKNSRLQITGLLLYVGHHFLQILEGDRKRVEELYGQIEHDRRHRSVTCIAATEVPAREFESWSMGFERFGVMELRRLAGFHDVRAVEDLDKMARQPGPLLLAMRAMYVANREINFRSC